MDIEDEELREYYSTMYLASRKLALSNTTLPYDPIFNIKVLATADVDIEVIQRQLPVGK